MILYSPYVIRQIKLVDHVARMGDISNEIIFVADIDMEISLKDRNATFEDNIKANFEGIMTEDVDLFHLAQDKINGERLL